MSWVARSVHVYVLGGADGTLTESRSDSALPEQGGQGGGESLKDGDNGGCWPDGETKVFEVLPDSAFVGPGAVQFLADARSCASCQVGVAQLPHVFLKGRVQLRELCQRGLETAGVLAGSDIRMLLVPADPTGVDLVVVAVDEDLGDDLLRLASEVAGVDAVVVQEGTDGAEHARLEDCDASGRVLDLVHVLRCVEGAVFAEADRLAGVLLFGLVEDRRHLPLGGAPQQAAHDHVQGAYEAGVGASCQRGGVAQGVNRCQRDLLSELQSGNGFGAGLVLERSQGVCGR